LVQINLRAFQNITIDTNAAAAQVLVTLDSAASAGVNLQSYSSQFAAFCDMYRYVRLDMLTVTIQRSGAPATGAGDTGYTGYVLTYVPPGANNPILLTSIESHHHTWGIPGTLGFGATATFGGGFGNPKYPCKLKVPGSALLPPESSPGPGRLGWIPTQADGPDTTAQNWGAITLVSSVAATAAGTIPTFVKVEFTASFYELLDPVLIASKRKAREGSVMPVLQPVPSVVSSTDLLSTMDNFSSPEAEISESQLLLERLLKKYPKST